jgi:hypothetical protein
MFPWMWQDWVIKKLGVALDFMSNDPTGHYDLRMGTEVGSKHQAFRVELCHFIQ